MPRFLEYIRCRRHKGSDEHGFPRLPDAGLPSAGLKPPSPPSPRATAESALFQTLPVELRQHILIAAFGARTVHMNLALETLPSKVRPTLAREAQHRHAATPRPFYGDPALPREWKWRSSVCHYSCFDHRDWSLKTPRGSRSTERQDQCLEGDAACDYFTKVPPPFGCFIGIMGWLLTCRQAYSEGIDVLYTTNTIRLHGTHIFYYLPKLISQLRLDDISTVSLFWDLGSPIFCGPYRLPQEFVGLEGLETLLRMLPATLPNLKRLHLSLYGFWWQNLQIRVNGWRSLEMYNATEDLLRTIMSSVVHVHSLADCRISLPLTIYQPWVQEATDTTVVFRNPPLVDLPAESLWRELPREVGPSDQTRSSITGYWVHNGVQDLRRLQP